MTWGDAAALGGALGWAISAVIVKASTARVRAIRINAYYVFLTAALSLAVAAIAGRFAQAFTIDGVDSAMLLGGALIGGTGDLAVLRAITLGDLGRNYTTATAVFVLVSAFGGWLILDESISGFVLGGGALILAGVYLTNVSNSALANGWNGRPSFRNWPNGTGAPAFAIVAGLLWAASLFLYDDALVGNDVIAANALSHLAPVVVYAAIVAWWRPARLTPISREDGVRIVVSGLLFGASLISLIVAIDLSEASSTAVLVSSSPLFMVPLAVVFLRETLTRRTATGVAVTLAGVFLVVGWG